MLPSLEIQFDEDEIEEISLDEVDELLEDDLLFEDEPEEDDGAAAIPAAPSREEPTADEESTDRALVAPSLAAAMARASSPELLVNEVSLDEFGLEELIEPSEEADTFHDSEAPTHVAAAPAAAPLPEPELASEPEPVIEERGSDRPTDPEGLKVDEAVPSAEAPSVSTPSPASEPSPVSAATSVPPQEPFQLAPSAQLPEVREVPVEPSRPPLETHLDGVSLADVSGLQDLPEDAQAALVAGAQCRDLALHEEINSFGVALVLRGTVEIMPAVADASCAQARRGEVVFTRGSLEDAVALRVVASAPGTRVAIWSDEQLSEATAACPWVADDLALVADRYQALAGAVMGSLGDSLDAMFRGMVLDKCAVRRFDSGEVLLEAGNPVDGMYIVGAGWLELLGPDGKVAEELGPGDFLFPETILAAGAATATVRIGRRGALVLYASRMDAHELLATCPPFIELLAR